MRARQIWKETLLFIFVVTAGKIENWDREKPCRWAAPLQLCRAWRGDMASNLQLCRTWRGDKAWISRSRLLLQSSRLLLRRLGDLPADIALCHSGGA